MNLTVSVILPTFNGEKYIRQAIDSALAQSLPPYEIIVVDDGSTDGTENIVRGYGSKIRYIYQENKGVSGAYNAGIAVASGNYVAFLEHDDVWAPEKNACQVQCFENDGQLGMVFSPVLLLEEGKPSKHNVVNLDDGGGDVTFAAFFARNRVLNCSTVMIRRSVLEDVGCFLEELPLSFDYDLWLRIAAKYRVVCLSEPLATYRIHSNNLSKDANDLVASVNSLKVILSWTDDPFARAQVGRNMEKRRVAELCCQSAWYCAKLERKEEELRYLWMAVKAQPLQFGNWRDYFWRSLDRRTRNKLVWYARKLIGQSKKLSTRK
jgi:glycosyltransferase involved in cell wall biosynthesis